MEFDGLRIIAVRIRPGCASYIRKCLKDNATYYLCNDYQISSDGMYVSKASKHIAPLDLSFFDTVEGNAPQINKIGFVSPERRYEAPTVARPPQM